jgi:sugar lactone lactonase YvrE
MKLLLTRRTIVGCAVVGLLAGCGGSQSPIGASGAMPSMPMLAPRLPVDSSALAPAAGPNLYVGSDTLGYSEVRVYAPDSSTPLRTITDGLAYVRAIGLRAGELYVVNGDSRSTVTVYQKGGAKLLRTIKKGMYDPMGLAFAGGSGNLFVANRWWNIPRSSVTVYNAIKGGSPLQTITRGVDKPVALASDAVGTMYVANSQPFRVDGHQGSVAVYTPGKDLPKRIITKGIANPSALALDGSGNLYVANVNVPKDQPQAVTVYAKGSIKVLRMVTDGVADPRALAIDGSGKLYVANWAPRANVTIYGKGSTKLLRTISKGLDLPCAMAFDGSGNLYVANKGASKVTVYDPKTGALLRTISQGSLRPVALTFGP